MGNKVMKRKFGRKVIDGSMTLADAWNRLERAELEKRARRARQGRLVGKSAGSGWPAPAAEYQPGREAEYMQSAFGPLVPPLQPTTIQKARQNAADRQYEQAMGPVREFIAKASQPAAVSLAPAPAPGLVVKQLSQPERAMVAELRRQLARVAHIPARREEVHAQILRITGDPFTTGAV